MNVKGKNIIITGGSLGIGKETARNLVKKGANVLITGRSENRLIEAKSYTGSKIIEFDISDHENMCKNAKKCIDILDGRVDVLINNAGIGVRKSVDELNIEDFLKVFNVNVFGLALFTKEIIPYMIKESYGTIINIGSKWFIPSKFVYKVNTPNTRWHNFQSRQWKAFQSTGDRIF